MTRLPLPLVLILLLTISTSESYAQDSRLIELGNAIDAKTRELESLKTQVEDIYLDASIADLKAAGLPSEDYVAHKAMLISFNPESQQAAWVAHKISTDIIKGSISRTNDFRDDPLIDGEGVEEDYFLKELQADGSYLYDGFGYDRGHLAPSADFRWSAQALSESYFYSNMSPMDPDFNREAWAEMEGILRAYVTRNEVPLYVVTLPVTREGTKRIERGLKKLTIPSEFIKVAVDPANGKGVAFKMANRNLDDPLSTFCYSIDDMESYVGLDFFSEIVNEDELESGFEIEDWFPSSASGGVEPILATSLSPGYINTAQAKVWMGSSKKVSVCGTVVSSRFSGSGNYWFNLDKKFPDTVFSVYIRKDDFVNFDSVHPEYLLNEKVCVEGKVRTMYGMPNMNIQKQEVITILSP